MGSGFLFFSSEEENSEQVTSRSLITQATYDVKKSLQLQRHLMPKSPQMMTMTYWIGDRQQRIDSTTSTCVKAVPRLASKLDDRFRLYSGPGKALHSYGYSGRRQTLNLQSRRSATSLKRLSKHDHCQSALRYRLKCIVNPSACLQTSLESNSKNCGLRLTDSHHPNPPQPQSLFANDSQLSVYCTHGVAIAATPRFIVGRLTGTVRKSFLPANGSH